MLYWPGYRQLAAAVLHQALQDHWNWRRREPTDQEKSAVRALGYHDPRAEVRAFFESEWVDELCDGCDLQLDAFLQAASRGPF